MAFLFLVCGLRDTKSKFKGEKVAFIDHNCVAMRKRSATAYLRLVNCPALIAEVLNGGSNNQNE
jgi:hypothetical protein